MPAMKEQQYLDDRPPEYFTKFHERARKQDKSLTYEFIRLLMLIGIPVLYRVRYRGRKNIPDAGPAILAPNHFSIADHFLVGLPCARWIRFVGKSQLFKRPLEWIISPGGAIPVRRGHRDEESFKTACSVLGRGGVVLMYSEGGRARDKKIGKARHGVGRLALKTGVPVIPIAIIGSQDARDWRRLKFPRVLVVYGKPMRYEREEDPPLERQLEVANQILDAVKQLYVAHEHLR